MRRWNSCDVWIGQVIDGKERRGSVGSAGYLSRPGKQHCNANFSSPQAVNTTETAMINQIFLNLPVAGSRRFGVLVLGAARNLGRRSALAEIAPRTAQLRVRPETSQLGCTRDIVPRAQ